MKKPDEELADKPLDLRHRIVEKINKRDLKPMYQTDHQHVYELDHSDQEEGYAAYMCSVPNCNLGFLRAKD